jgi:hypothetical protein
LNNDQPTKEPETMNKPSKKARADFRYSLIDDAALGLRAGLPVAPRAVFITDLNCGGVSVTNDVENVLHDINAELIALGATGLANRFVCYRDSDGQIDRLHVDDHGQFAAFGKRVSPERLDELGLV